jgi:hypothetical protein
METTLNMPTDILEIVNREACARGMTRSEMIVFLIKKCHHRFKIAGNHRLEFAA